MSDYLDYKFDENNSVNVSVIDEVPFWSGPFGFTLLENLTLRKHMTILDIGCGTGFPSLEIAMRAGNSSKVHALDPWPEALARLNQKAYVMGISNIEPITGNAEELPFDDSYFDLIVSNNGINNVQDIEETFSECRRVLKPEGKFLFTMNLGDTMKEFYEIFRKILVSYHGSVKNAEVDNHVREKRKPAEEIISLLGKYGFDNFSVLEKSFNYSFVDGPAMLNYFMIKAFFMPPWRKIAGKEHEKEIFSEVESELNRRAEQQGEIVLTIPYVLIECAGKV